MSEMAIDCQKVAKTISLTDANFGTGFTCRNEPFCFSVCQRFFLCFACPEPVLVKPIVTLLIATCVRPR
jgi:hypothetical protein